MVTTGAAGGGGATVNRTSVRGAQPAALPATMATTCAPGVRPLTTRGDVQADQTAPSREHSWRSTDPRADHSTTTVVAGVVAGGAERSSIAGGAAGTARPRTITWAATGSPAARRSTRTVSPLRAPAAADGVSSATRGVGPSRTGDDEVRAVDVADLADDLAARPLRKRIASGQQPVAPQRQPRPATGRVEHHCVAGLQPRHVPAARADGDVRAARESQRDQAGADRADDACEAQPSGGGSPGRAVRDDDRVPQADGDADARADRRQRGGDDACHRAAGGDQEGVAVTADHGARDAEIGRPSPTT